MRPAHAGNVATADSAATMAWNPAGITRLEKSQFVVDAIMAVSTSKFEVNDKTTVDELCVRWPNGQETVYRNLPAQRYHDLKQE